MNSKKSMAKVDKAVKSNINKFVARYAGNRKAWNT
jgi:hypothetical protein